MLENGLQYLQQMYFNWFNNLFIIILNILEPLEVTLVISSTIQISSFPNICNDFWCRLQSYLKDLIHRNNYLVSCRKHNFSPLTQSV